MRGLCARVYLIHAALYLGGDILYTLLLCVLEIGIYLGDDAVVFAVNHDLVNYIQFFELLASGETFSPLERIIRFLTLPVMNSCLSSVT